ncbi:MAG TPA: hypothetical protein VMG31_03350 [Verrucomicrobiae bacterium]|nr:hypothetical protein [Verrucomicrobiae bacterium]
MLQAHSFLWHYLWVGPNLLLLFLAFLLYRRKLHTIYPFFFAFALIGSLEQLTLYAADVIPSVTPATWWHIYWAGLMVEAVLKFGVVAEIFAHVFNSYSAIAKLGRTLISGVGVVLVFTAAILAAFAPKNGHFGIVFGAHLLDQTVYLVESGLLLFIFLFSAYFHLSAGRRVFGIAFGLAISACVHLATWAVMANGGLQTQRDLLDLLNMATYHLSVLIWYEFLLVPGRDRVFESGLASDSLGARLEGHLADWNDELERLLKQ